MQNAHHHSHEHDHTHDATPIDEWLGNSTHLCDADLDSFRMVSKWREENWQPFPDAGSYQETRLTAAASGGTCSAIWLKLEPDEGFDPHQHPNAIHTMIVFEGEADLFWKDDGTVYSTTMQKDRTPYVVLPTMPHAIVANRGSRAVILVLNTPPDDIARDDYSLPIAST